MEAVRFSGVTASDDGRGGVDDLWWSVPTAADRGTAVAVVGPPRSGTSTVLRLMVDLVHPERGTVEVWGLDTTESTAEVRRRCGYLPADFRVPSELSGLGVLSHLSGLRGSDVPGTGMELAERLSLDLDRPVTALSAAEHRKLGVVQAMMSRPQLLLLDEPTRDLDEPDAATVRALVTAAVDGGAVAIVTAHELRSIRDLADRVLVMRQGRLVFDSPAAPLLERARRQVEVEMADPAEATDFARSSPLTDVAVTGAVVRGVVTGDVDDVVKAAARHHTVRLVTHEPDLSGTFWEPHARAV